MSTEVDEIKKKLDITTVIQKYLPLKKRGHHYLACCPFHQEKTPSFIVSPELQIFKCFGCGKSGDVFTFLQEYERIDFREALEELAKMAGVKIESSPAFSRQETRKKTLFDINKEVSRFYHYILTSHPLGKSALDYIQNRGLKKETIKKFQIGFSPGRSDLLVNHLLKKGFTPQDLVATGTFGYSQYGQRRLYDRFQDRLTFPLVDYRGHILGFSGRILPTSKNPNLAKYINSPETEIYHKSSTLFGINLAKEAIRRDNFCIIVEGEFDMITPWEQGIENIVAIKGTALTQEQLELLRRYTDTLILALDSDFAGNAAARKSIELAENLEFDVKVLRLNDQYKDPDEAARNNPGLFKQELQNALPVWDFLIDSNFKTYGADNIKGKKLVLQNTLPFLVKIKNSVIRSDYLKKLADSIGSDLDSVILESKNYSSQINQKPVTTLAPPASKNVQTDPLELNIEKKEEYLLSLVLGTKRPGVVIQKVLEAYSLATKRLIGIAQHLASEEDFDPKVFSQKIPPELHPTFAQLYLEGTTQELDSLARQNEIQKLVTQLKIVYIKDKLLKLSQQIARDSLSEDDKASPLELEYNQLLMELSRLQTKKG